MEDIELKGCVYRIRKCAFDLLSMEEDLVVDDDDDGDDEGSWDLIGKEFQLKAAFLYCDLSKVISSAKDERKKALADLGNKLLYLMEEVVMLMLLSLPNSLLTFLARK